MDCIRNRLSYQNHPAISRSSISTTDRGFLQSSINIRKTELVQYLGLSVSKPLENSDFPITRGTCSKMTASSM